MRRAALLGELVPGGVEGLPHLGGDHVACGQRVLPGRPERALDGAGADRVEGEPGQDRVHVAVLLGRDGHAEDGVQRAAGGVLVAPRVLEQPVQIGVQDAGGVVGALHVTADPEQGFGDPGEHGVGGDHCWCPSSWAGPPGVLPVPGPN
ncbi:hypothetical protein GCM10009664_56170 [Kitasatospora gansuensis]